MSAYDLVTPRGSPAQMRAAARLLDRTGSAFLMFPLTSGEKAGLAENARMVAVKYWARKGNRSLQGLQLQLNKARWAYIGQVPYARDVMTEIEADSGLKMAYYP